MKQIMMIPKEDFTDCFETIKGYWDEMKTLKWTKTNGGYVFVDNNQLFLSYTDLLQGGVYFETDQIAISSVKSL